MPRSNHSPTGSDFGRNPFGSSFFDDSDSGWEDFAPPHAKKSSAKEKTAKPEKKKHSEPSKHEKSKHSEAPKHEKSKHSDAPKHEKSKHSEAPKAIEGEEPQKVEESKPPAPEPRRIKTVVHTRITRWY